MQKNYVLLRNDQQTGPYSLEEIIQFDLKPYDLIWIEGESKGWYYPQEIMALHPYLAFLPKPKPVAKAAPPAAKKVHVAVPVAPTLEAPIVPPSVPPPVYVPQEAFASFAPAPKNLEEEVFAQFKEPLIKEAVVESVPLVSKKKKSPSPVGVAIAAVLVVGGVFAASWIMNRHSGEEETSTENIVAAPAQNEIDTAAVANINNAKKSPRTFVAKQKKEKNSVAPKQKTTTAKKAVLPEEDSKISANNSVAETSEAGAAPPVNDEAVAKKEEPSTPAETTTAPQGKKKKLRDKIMDIFRKKPEEQKNEGAKPVETESGERRATRRDDGANLAQMVNVRFDVPNSWMMGIKGAKATLVNRSNETVSKAAVEVSYYDDDNNLLQKKTVTFSKVDGKGSKTVSIPDHSTATKVDYSIVSVTGEPGA